MGVNTLRFSLLLLILALAGTISARAQYSVGIPSIQEADSLLSVGIRAFDQGRYETARSTFDRILTEFEDNAATTTAVLFAAKSAYRTAEYPEARAYLSGFTGAYPSSGYVDDAALLDEMALQASGNTEDLITNVGVILSLSEDERAATQEMFNGVRLAIEAHNRLGKDTPIRMIYRDIEGGATAARRAMRELASEDVAFVIGTLFSEEAIAAAQEAERTKTVFLAPLATDERVAENKNFTFQANPSMSVRGAAMARFAVNGLRLDSLAVIIADDDRNISEKLSDGFVEEASRLGAETLLVSILPDESSLYQLADEFPSDTLNDVQAVYIPIVSNEPIKTAGAVMSNLDRITRLLFSDFGTSTRAVRILGNASWHDLPQLTHASNYTATYGNDFLLRLETTAYQELVSSFNELSGHAPGRLGVTGYDVTTFALEALFSDSSLPLEELLRRKSPFEGVGLRIHFDQNNVNQALFYHRYRDGKLTLIR
ncbi:MAG: ABC transporter substrate-binding protein [Bacteroidetes Order II. Incertae sedis bacterium]|jgi:branched-chain amino acid transport system substrate-binding protein|nr:ABC transporter substrate-binding protein [Bacteroidetes Order II. bacterium]MBT4053337.1 ABC transporter substrate-binding protein [Bacteroidetes Order II. bacterium]MBT4601631.1 ABC transporter substrate-binding protein [Bacteroidetes Order II. bacterium]MBT5249961.1 ABC transporter substrate-binding protein [Bacteroidetes Order II. bacterium]MBT6200625.1 ABC transporter substrate-binding protein [Bacteroidetes Order II. bacterium]